MLAACAGRAAGGGAARQVSERRGRDSHQRLIESLGVINAAARACACHPWVCGHCCDFDTWKLLLLSTETGPGWDSTLEEWTSASSLLHPSTLWRAPARPDQNRGCRNANRQRRSGPREGQNQAEEKSNPRVQHHFHNAPFLPWPKADVRFFLLFFQVPVTPLPSGQPPLSIVRYFLSLK